MLASTTGLNGITLLGRLLTIAVSNATAAATEAQ